MTDACTVCEGPSDKSIHFGARVCKACTAFFRRAIQLKVTYQCKMQHDCVVHYELRVTCKRCRFDRCLKAGMDPSLVQPRRRLDSPLQENFEYNETPAFSFSSIASSADETYIIELYTKVEMSMNDRRKLIFTNTRLHNLLGFKCECPFEREHLRSFDFRSYSGCTRHEFAMALDYTKAFPDFDKMSVQDQSMLFCTTTGIDYIMNMAFYSHLLGMEEKIVVFPNCTYYPMDPPPMSGKEPDAFHYFKDKEEFDKYVSMIPPMYVAWNQLVHPLHQLNPSFKEFVLLKALTCWQIAYYKLGPEGRAVCERERNNIIRALFSVVRENNFGEDVVSRFGEIVLFMGTTIKETYTLASSIYMMTFFDILDCDPLLRDLLDLSPLAETITPEDNGVSPAQYCAYLSLFMPYMQFK